MVEAVEDDEPNWACARVSKQVQSWVEPILYRSIVLGMEKPRNLSSLSMLGAFECLHRTILHHPAKPDGFFAMHVKKLGFRTLFDEGKTLEIMAACPNVSQLEYRTSILYQDASADVLKVGGHTTWEKVRPKWLLIHANMFVPKQRYFGAPIFKNVTRLELIWNFNTTWNLPSLVLLRALTHLCISTSPFDPDPRIAIAAMSNLSAMRQSSKEFVDSLVVCIFSITNIEFAAGPAIQYLHTDPASNVVVALDDVDFYEAFIEQDDEESKKIAEGLIPRSTRSEMYTGIVNEAAFWKRAEDKVKERARLLTLRNSLNDSDAHQADAEDE
ncbi:hypothetical protein DFP72DRAFT_1064445 [Ephemerocybe angulata]|uniref:Uncharacterized protein n=1 Tax=Ephemerocybe angulata TaxID=980116 RepID=A0A8H6I6S9_9AGAR|nr:hypothetical protein DFP72DRAFT_1064445 [Tulosesus angulatus]